MEGGAGRSAWDPRLLACIWVYAYTRGIGSARASYQRAHRKPDCRRPGSRISSVGRG